ncbi:hypothetical protein [Geminocystis sp. GBBB08]|uniref:hypothetical protein n=1 Tax=Geminocystis sp. GBBB08 TaxID=2604140 RepID=UPI0027E2E62D|nr:hypothetical protein [Geminocystis sp. GBBB08]MBL1209246.1 hypothetical protein [Geminocystis sp. GBBB08]
MVRNLTEVVDSQARMLENLNKGHLIQPKVLVMGGLQQNLMEARQWLNQNSIPTIDIDYV